MIFLKFINKNPKNRIMHKNIMRDSANSVFRIGMHALLVRRPVAPATQRYVHGTLCTERRLKYYMYTIYLFVCN